MTFNANKFGRAAFGSLKFSFNLRWKKIVFFFFGLLVVCQFKSNYNFFLGGRRY